MFSNNISFVLVPLLLFGIQSFVIAFIVFLFRIRPFPYLVFLLLFPAVPVWFSCGELLSWRGKTLANFAIEPLVISVVCIMFSSLVYSFVKDREGRIVVALIISINVLVSLLVFALMPPLQE
jgi:hypothetical protein